VRHLDESDFLPTMGDLSGEVGWTQPDPELFEEFVGPATERLPATPPRGRKRPDRPGTDEDHVGHQTVQGENT
jgi:hypothetical protein